MRVLPVNDVFTKNGVVRVDGRHVHDLYLVEVKKPEDSKGPWDVYKVLATVPAAQAFKPLDAACPQVKP
jgi:branched-chain amino acid transport system substrate-binding protein